MDSVESKKNTTYNAQINVKKCFDNTYMEDENDVDDVEDVNGGGGNDDKEEEEDEEEDGGGDDDEEEEEEEEEELIKEKSKS